MGMPEESAEEKGASEGDDVWCSKTISRSVRGDNRGSAMFVEPRFGTGTAPSPGNLTFDCPFIPACIADQ